MKTLLFVLTCVCMFATPALADHKFGKQVRFVGMHPIPKSEGGGICYIEGPHVHIYAANKLEYRVHDDDHVFVGDPVAYGYDGPKYAYKGPHPVQLTAEIDPNVEYCYIEGPHYHYFAPPESPDFRVVGDAYFYVGTPPPVFIEARPTYYPINAYYRPMVYTRPVVEVEAPVGWIGARAEWVGPGVVVGAPGAVIVGKHGRAEVVGPAVGVGVGVDVGVVVPPPPSIHVGVGIGVGVAPGPVIIEGHHDNGRHEGWHKHH